MGLITPTQGKLLVDGKGYPDPHTRVAEQYRLRPPIGAADRREPAAQCRVRYLRAPEVDEANGCSNHCGWPSWMPCSIRCRKGLDTPLREQGIRLSGGERKRVGIARALYGDPQVLVLDEATADLDNETEQAFTQTLLGLKGRKTIIVIAHRLRMVEGCDTILFMEDGTVVDSGPPAKVFERHPELSGR